ncbi:Fic family protein [Mycoplasmopsis iners]|uniref:Fic family protein n=1 Tax=Mycoplasmopsis iners TaxID=76630 RepID=UPI000496D847|nr:Fic family protein [Mycoplasmopsis iners]
MKYKDYSQQLVDILQGQVYFENLLITKLETENILNDKFLNENEEKFIIATNIKNAWKFIFETYDLEISPDYVLQLHKILMKSLDLNNGNFRNISVKVLGATYVPPLLVKSQYYELIQDCMSKNDDIYSLPLLIAREQFFNDGNKRTATMLLQKELLKQGKLFNLNLNVCTDYRKALLKYYQELEDNYLKQVIDDNTINLKRNKVNKR